MIEILAGSQGLVSISSPSTQATASLGARYRLTERWQAGGVASFRYQSTSSASSTGFQALVGPTFNLGLGEAGELSGAWFFSALAGLTTGNTLFNGVVVAAGTEFTAAARAGKRFELTPAVSYAPSVGVVKEARFDASFVLEPIAVSVFF